MLKFGLFPADIQAAAVSITGAGKDMKPSIVTCNTPHPIDSMPYHVGIIYTSTKHPRASRT